jgi:hypothetical protein
VVNKIPDRVVKIRMRWFFLTAVGLTCVLLIASQMALPGVFEEFMMDGLIASIEETGSVDLQVTAYPALKMFWGRFDYLKADGTDIVIGNVPVSQIFFEISGLTLDSKKLMTKRTLEVRSLKGGNMTLLLTEEGINTYFHGLNDSFDRFHIDLSDNIPKVVGNVEILGIKLDIRVEGRFIVENSTKIKFIADKLVVENTQVPRLLINQLMNELDLTLDLGKIPLPLNVRDVKVEENNILIISEVR